MSRACIIGLNPSTAGAWKFDDGTKFDEARDLTESLGMARIDNDNTIRREIAIAQNNGHWDGEVYARFNADRTRRLILARQGLVKVNLFSIISTNPKGLLEAEDPEGDPENMDQILSAAKASDVVIAAWGGPYSPMALYRFVLARSRIVVEALTGLGVELYVLGLTKDGFPRHPLYLKNDTVPQLWTTFS
jgi:hypothetical protein